MNEKLSIEALEVKFPEHTSIEIMLSKKWMVYDREESEIRKLGFYLKAEDISIITEDGEEVVGCSEWMRAEREIFEYIVKLHNDKISNKQEK